MRKPAFVILVGSLLVVAGGGAWYWASSRTRPADITLQLRAFALNLDPATLADTESRKVATLLYTGLVAVDQDGTVHPGIAKTWRKRDERTWEFQLIDGITFPDATRVTSAEVSRSLCASMQPGHIQSWSLASIERRSSGPDQLIECTGLVPEGPDTLLIRESAQTPWLMEALAGPGGWIVDTDPSKKGPYGVRPGTGPFLVASIVADRRITLERRKTGTAIATKVDRIAFDYVPDPNVAARLFESGRLDLIEIDSPQLADLLLTPAGALQQGKGHLTRYGVDRVRVVALNLKRLAAKGFSEPSLRAFFNQYSKAIPRKRIADQSHGLAIPLESGFPPYTGQPSSPPELGETAAFPELTLTLITENDPFSDMIAAGLPQGVGKTQIKYQAMEKSLLIAALLKGDFDAVLMKLEATHHTPKFWTAFFTPGNPYVIFGYPVEGISAFDLSQPSGIKEAASLVDSRGNWLGVLREIGLYATASRITGVRLTSSGQLSFEKIGVSQ
jgi:ABC-type transport system substrate-binding protein